MKRLLFALPLVLPFTLTGCLPQIPGLTAPLTPATGGTVALTVNNTGSANADTSAFGAGVQLGGSSNIVSMTVPGLKIRKLDMVLGGKPAAGSSYTVSQNPTSGAAQLIYTEADATNPTGGKSWTSSGGTVKVDSVNGGAVAFTLTNVTFAKTGSDSTNAATGTFTMSGTIKADKLSGM